METFIKADIFFFLTSILVVCAIVVLVFAGVYIVQTLRNLRDISEKLKGVAELAGSDFEALHERLTQSWIYSFLFGAKKKARKTKQAKS